MKFGKRLQIQIDETLPEWRDKFLSYKPLKKRLKQVAGPEWFTAVGLCAASPQHDGSSSSVVDKFIQELRKGSAALGEIVDKPANESVAEAASSKPASEIGAGINDEVSSESSTHAPAERNSERKTGNFDEEDFINLINEELEKFNNFFLEKEEEYVIHLQIEHKNMCRRQTKTRGHKIWRMPGTNLNVGKRQGQTPMWGNPLIKSSYYSSIVQQRERESTNIRIKCPKQSCQISSQQQQCIPNQKINGGKSSPKMSSKQLGQQQKNSSFQEGQSQPKIDRSNQSKEREKQSRNSASHHTCEEKRGCP